MGCSIEDRAIARPSADHCEQGSRTGGALSCASNAIEGVPSPPVRGRGSKQRPAHGFLVVVQSPPVRGRGSKQPERDRGERGRQRRPPCGGVDRNADLLSTLRRPAGRPPCGGVDRNLMTSSRPAIASRSPPVRGRGSKRPRGRGVRPGGESPPVRGRGSKPGPDRPAPRLAVVAPRAGAWIETSRRCLRSAPASSRPPCGGVDRNAEPVTINPATAGRPPCGGVDRNWKWSINGSAGSGRPPCGGVDRNTAEPPGT